MNPNNHDLKDKSDNTQTAKDYIGRIAKQLLTDYQQTKEERHNLALWEESQEFTILGVIEIFTTDIRGYASQVITSDNLLNHQEIGKNLDKLKIFNIPYFREWYFAPESNYPQIKRYVETLNYLRLLIIEYLNGVISSK
ncbi:MAG TPA: hypothetical protein DCL61_03410 [Cyanobacteria bacterium UBA12227]|nr:hypothetical protein [Cyanobacteria bacterium UBA12227]HAX87879.1 hypothetical protein [Cyanobacteria bacterium UBA11370]HBY79663.1 hypothetical protein [Cyanobacteria bacterium UBA11148]